MSTQTPACSIFIHFVAIMNFTTSQNRRRKTKWRLYLGTTPRRYLGRHSSKHDRWSLKIGLWGKEDLLDERLSEAVQTWLWRICPHRLWTLSFNLRPISLVPLWWRIVNTSELLLSHTSEIKQYLNTSLILKVGFICWGMPVFLKTSVDILS
jgi:hypothetical protein